MTEPLQPTEPEARSTAEGQAAGSPEPEADRIARLERAARDLEFAEQIARIGSWTLDPTTGRATWSREMYRLLGLDPQDPPLRLEDAGRILTTASLAQLRGAIERAVATGEPWRAELEFVRPDGSHGWIVANGVAEFDAAGNVSLLRGTLQDVTEQHQLEGQLRQAQRLEAIGQLAGGIAHDFNNLLTAIRGYAELVLGTMAPNDPNRPDIEHIVDAANRATELTRQLLAFSRRQILRPVVVDPAEVVERIVPLLRRLLGEHIEVVTAVAPDVGRIRVDPTQFEQVIINLAVNARDAMPEGGRLGIEVANAVLDAGYVANHIEATAGPHVVLVVSDTGTGIDERILGRIFEPFFTTKPPGRGTGMGLATVYGIVKQSGGSIYVYSEPGHGTSFKVYLPRVAEEAEAPDPPVASGPGGSETILLVEDDAGVRRFAARTLGGLGYRVVEASGSAEAIAIADTVGEPIDLLVTDVTMPGLQGPQLASRLAAARPGLRVLYISGFAEPRIDRPGMGEARGAFLGKPFSGDALARAVRQVLDEPSGSGGGLGD